MTQELAYLALTIAGCAAVLVAFDRDWPWRWFSD